MTPAAERAAEIPPDYSQCGQLSAALTGTEACLDPRIGGGQLLAQLLQLVMKVPFSSGGQAWLGLTVVQDHFGVDNLKRCC